MRNRLFSCATLALALSAANLAQGADYLIDTKGAHAFIQFRIKHLGYSWLLGRFNDFEGRFSYEEQDPVASEVHPAGRDRASDP